MNSAGYGMPIARQYSVTQTSQYSQVVAVEDHALQVDFGPAHPQGSGRR